MVLDLRSGVGKSEWKVSRCKGLYGGSAKYIFTSYLFGKVIACLSCEPGYCGARFPPANMKDGG
jgi:hypothetical protein